MSDKPSQNPADMDPRKIETLRAVMKALAARDPKATSIRMREHFRNGLEAAV